jgi:hypothetical protein
MLKNHAGKLSRHTGNRIHMPKGSGKDHVIAFPGKTRQHANRIRTRGHVFDNRRFYFPPIKIINRQTRLLMRLTPSPCIDRMLVEHRDAQLLFGVSGRQEEHDQQTIKISLFHKLSTSKGRAQR